MRTFISEDLADTISTPTESALKYI
jgi:hypothetical protein